MLEQMQAFPLGPDLLLAFQPLTSHACHVPFAGCHLWEGVLPVSGRHVALTASKGMRLMGLFLFVQNVLPVKTLGVRLLRRGKRRQASLWVLMRSRGLGREPRLTFFALLTSLVGRSRGGTFVSFPSSVPQPSFTILWLLHHVRPISLCPLPPSMSVPPWADMLFLGSWSRRCYVWLMAFLRLGIAWHRL